MTHQLSAAMAQLTVRIALPTLSSSLIALIARIELPTPSPSLLQSLLQLDFAPTPTRKVGCRKAARLQP